jgi:hypothetical protein
VPGSLQSSEKAQLITELTDVKTNLERLLRQYEKDFGEHFSVTTNVSGVTLPLQDMRQISNSATSPAVQSPAPSNGPPKVSTSIDPVSTTNESPFLQQDVSISTSTVQNRISSLGSKTATVSQRRNFPSH